VVDVVREFIGQVKTSNGGEVRLLQVLVNVPQLYSEGLNVRTRREVVLQRRAREPCHQDPFELQRRIENGGLGVGTVSDDLGSRDTGDVLREEAESGDFGCGFVERIDGQGDAKEIVSWRVRLRDGVDLVETAAGEEAKANVRVGMTRRQVSKMVSDNCAHGGGRGLLDPFCARAKQVGGPFESELKRWWRCRRS